MEKNKARFLLQWKLLVSSMLRRIMVILFILLHLPIYPIFRRIYYSRLYPEEYYISDWYSLFYAQENLDIFCFILLLFLSYDFFLEIRNTSNLLMLKASRTSLRNDLSQAFVLFCLLFLNVCVYLAAQIRAYAANTFLNTQITLYFIEFAANFMLGNGILAILIGWFLARSTHKLPGYLLCIFFSYAFSPAGKAFLNNYAILNYGYSENFRIFFLMPEATFYLEPCNLTSVNISLESRTLFWIMLFVSGLVLIYKGEMKRKLFLVSVTSSVCLTLVMLWSAYLPYSYYSPSDTLGRLDSESYDILYYDFEDHEVTPEEAEAFQIKEYDMDIKLGRIMKNTVTMVPDRKLDFYGMTLYHVYEVDSVKDAAGTLMNYSRKEDYLTIYPSENNDTSRITVSYHGGSSTFYSNYRQVNLPGWFPYYPMPGYRDIIVNQKYVNNISEEASVYHVKFHNRTNIYSDLEETGDHVFSGASMGPTFVAGFYTEKVYKDRVRYIYPYTDHENDPDISRKHPEFSYGQEVKQSYDYVMTQIEEQELPVRVIISTPNITACEASIYLPDRIERASIRWSTLKKDYEENGTFEPKGLVTPD